MERLLSDPLAYSTAMSFLEDVQNITSHQHDDLDSDAEVQRTLGPRGRIAWQSLTLFWRDVADWSDHQDALPVVPTPSAISSIANPELRTLALAMLRRLDDDRNIGLPHAALYEHSGSGSLPNYSHLDALRDS